MFCLTSAYSEYVEPGEGNQQGPYNAGVAGRWHTGIDRPLTNCQRTGNRLFLCVRAADRRQAQVEIDAIVALSLGVTADELCTIYRTQFAVLYGYDRNFADYDANGRLVPNSVLAAWRQKGDHHPGGAHRDDPSRASSYTYELPFVTLDREADMRQAYAHFERILQERS